MPYVPPTCTVESVTELSSFAVDWISIAAVILITAGQTLNLTNM